MLEIEKKKLFFKSKEIWFSDSPFDVKGYQAVTFRECKNKVDATGFKRKEFTTLVIDLSQDLDNIWKKMDNTSCRYGVNRAKRDGVNILRNSHYDEFVAINQSFRVNKGLDEGAIDIEFMKKYGMLLVAEFKGEIIGGHFYLEDGENMRSLVAASKRLSVDKKMATLIGNANKLLIWEAINIAREKGIREFDMGGYYTGKTKDEQKEKINSFKKSFGSDVVTHYVYEKYYSSIFKCFRLIRRICG